MTAVAATLAVYLMLYIVGRIEFFVRPAALLLYHRYGLLARRLEAGDAAGPDLYHYAATCGAYIFGLLLTAVLDF